MWLLMNEPDFLASYDPAAFPHLAVAVDVVVLTLREGALHLLTVRRSEQPARGKLALPGTFVGVDEELDAAARRAVRQKAGVDGAVRQFQTFGGVGRDPRMRIISVGYMALLPWAQVDGVGGEDRPLLRLDGDVLRGATGRKQLLAFDHEQIVAAALADLRANLDGSAFGYGLLPAEFTLRELQQAHEAVRNRSLNKPAFRKRLVESGWIEPTGRLDVGGKFRPAELYRVAKEHARDR